MEDKIKEIIEREFQAEVLEIKRITEGYSHYMYEVKINKEPEIVIIRFSNNTKPDSNLGKEKYVMELLEKNNIPVPKIYAFTKEYIIMEKLSGKRLDTIWDSLTKQEKIEITEKIGKLLRNIHNIKLKKFGKILEGGKIESDNAFEFRKMGEKTPYNAFLREWLKDSLKDMARILSYEHIPKQIMINIFTYLTENLDKINYKGKPVLTHADFMPGHIFVEKNKENGEYEITGIIDFEFAYAFSPEYDFIKLHRAGFFQDPELKKALEEGYGNINEKAVKIYRVIRDLGFAWAVLEAGNKELSDKIIKELDEKTKIKEEKSKWKKEKETIL